MYEGRKRVRLLSASIIASRRLAHLDFKPCPAYEAAIGSAILAAYKIMRQIDSNWPKREHERDIWRGLEYFATF
jgi:hypothetical protein